MSGRRCKRTLLAGTRRRGCESLGVDWDRIGLVAHASDVSGLGARIHDVDDVHSRRARVAALQPLFTPRGVAAYVAFKLAACFDAAG